MTVTRKQATMTDNALVHRSSDGITTSEQQPSPYRKWMGIAVQMAQDKRHDLAPEVLKLWIKKLERHPDDLVCEALVSGIWEYFPSVDQVISQVERIQDRKRQDSANREWDHWKANMKRAQEEGLMATEEDYAEMRAALRKHFGDPTAKQTGRG